MDDPDDPVDRGGRPRKLRPDEWTRIIRLHQKGASTRVIAAHLSRGQRRVSKDTVARFLRDVHASNEEVRLSLSALRNDAVVSWHKAMLFGSRYGRHAPAKDLLIATSTIAHEPAADHGVIIVVGDGRAPVAQLPPAPQVLPGEVVDENGKVVSSPPTAPAPNAAPDPPPAREWPFTAHLITSPNGKPPTS